jgi:hypothetical protein
MKQEKFIRVVQNYYLSPTKVSSMGVVYVETDTIDEAKNILRKLGWDLEETYRIDPISDWEGLVWEFGDICNVVDIIKARDRSCTLILSGGEIIRI